MSDLLNPEILRISIAGMRSQTVARKRLKTEEDDDFLFFMMIHTPYLLSFYRNSEEIARGFYEHCQRIWEGKKNAPDTLKGRGKNHLPCTIVDLVVKLLDRNKKK